MSTPSDRWCIMPFLDLPQMTWQAVEDCLAQRFPSADGSGDYCRTRVLLVDQGSSKESRDWIDRAIEQQDAPEPRTGRAMVPRVLCWHCLPALPSLAGVWNRALDFVWELDGAEALVVNNDVRLHPRTYRYLADVMAATGSLFVSAVGVTEKQFEEVTDSEYFEASLEHDPVSRGGPDFSCFLISRQGHVRYRFDEGFVPCYCEDLDTHRRYMLGGDGDRIYSVNIPYLHFASQTLKQANPDTRQRIERALGGSRRYYEAKWGGPVNQERFYSPFDQGVEGRIEGISPPMISTAGMPNPPTTPALQAWVQDAAVLAHDLEGF